jgi:hypothetical protein
MVKKYVIFEDFFRKEQLPLHMNISHHLAPRFVEVSARSVDTSFKDGFGIVLCTCFLHDKLKSQFVLLISAKK